MFGEHEKYKILLSISLLDLLIEKEYEEITSDLIIEKAKFTKENYIWMADDKVSLLKTYFDKYPYPKAQTITFFHHLTILV